MKSLMNKKPNRNKTQITVNITMTEQQDDTKRYKVIAINLLYPQQDFFLKGTWDGNEQNSPSLDVKLK